MMWAKRQQVGSPTRKLLLLVLADYADEAWSCFPGQATLAAETELSERSVRRQLAELEADGFITRTERRRDNGYRTSDRIVLCGANTSAEQPAKSAGWSPDNGDRSHRPMTTVSPATVAGQEPTGEPAAEPAVANEPRAQVTPHGQGELIPAPLRATPPSATWNLAWDAFWDAYPRKAGKLDAHKAWQQALRRGADPAQIVAGARRYAEDPNREDAYTAHPATWLRRGSWDDGPLPERGGAPRAQVSGALGSLAELGGIGQRAIGGGR